MRGWAFSFYRFVQNRDWEFGVGIEGVGQFGESNLNAID